MTSSLFLPVAESFLSVQGEGPLAGTVTHFIRVFGCDKQCDGWPCDTPHALAWTGARSRERWSVHELVEYIRTIKCDWVCFTGGEPTMYREVILSALSRLSSGEPGSPAGKKFSIETHGENDSSLLQLVPLLDQVVISPKLPSSGDPFRVTEAEMANLVDMWKSMSMLVGVAIKFVIGTEEDLVAFRKWLAVIGEPIVFSQEPSFPRDHGFQVFVQPVHILDEDNRGAFLTAARLFSSLVNNDQTWVRLSLQTHKMIGLP